MKKIIALLLLSSMLFSVAACRKKCEEHIDENLDGKCDICEAEVVDNNDGDNSDGTSSAVSPSSFKVKVVTEGGMPVNNVTVYVHKSDKEFDLTGAPKTTNNTGVVEFNLDEGHSYSVQLVSNHDRYIVPSGDYAYGRYFVDAEELVITIGYNPDYKPSVYALGDKLPNYILEDVKGNEYNLYNLLETKDMVMFNFWFINCPPCRAEFPAINSAYQNYQSKVEILAINNTDTAANIKSFPGGYGISIDFPLISARQGLNPGNFDSQYCPTTVIVDRYGVICLIEIGGIPNEEVWNNAFAYFTGDNYTQSLFTSITDIPNVT